MCSQFNNVGLVIVTQHKGSSLAIGKIDRLGLANLPSPNLCMCALPSSLRHQGRYSSVGDGWTNNSAGQLGDLLVSIVYRLPRVRLSYSGRPMKDTSENA